MKKAKTVGEYISSAPEEVKGKLIELRKIIKSTAPMAEEKISYGMPYYGYKGRLVYFAYAKRHIGLYIMPKVLVDFEDEIKDLRTGRATLRLSLDKKLPTTLIKRLIKAGIRKNEGVLK